MRRYHIPEEGILSHIAAETSKPAQIARLLYKPRSTNKLKATQSTQMQLLLLETMM
jgi:hypothetical protein